MSNCFAEFLKNAGLYDSAEITKDNINELCDLIGGKVKISAYCVGCKEMRVFSMAPIQMTVETAEKGIVLIPLEDRLKHIQRAQEMKGEPPWKTLVDKWHWNDKLTDIATRVITFPFACAMDDSHHLDYIVQTDSNKMIKIGQFPSIADLSFPELDEFKKVIDKESIRELHRAIGLYAQGIGVGSYVYLRRIFERILEEAKKQAEAEGTIDLSDYVSLRVSERIKRLKEYLPAMINSNPTIYGIVSKGIHELSEDDCIRYFPVLKESIIMILRQWAQKKKEEEDAKILEASLSKITTELS